MYFLTSIKLTQSALSFGKEKMLDNWIYSYEKLVRSKYLSEQSDLFMG